MNLSVQAWDWLNRELDLWAGSGLRADFWWRDDDAITSSTGLEQLLRIHSTRKVPVALAVIPATLHKDLAIVLDQSPGVSVLQHGYSHQDHSTPDQRSLELGGYYGAAQAGHGNYCLSHDHLRWLSALSMPRSGHR